ncbi:Non-classical phosphatidylinositol transfer protein (PITP) [Tulasnella sp. JGI-2019a]|nr:Non-classical phosphatidylinositol transfer protein (PITP) [Tulasnella sp. JGI-2019a]
MMRFGLKPCAREMRMGSASAILTKTHSPQNHVQKHGCGMSRKNSQNLLLQTKKPSFLSGKQPSAPSTFIMSATTPTMPTTAIPGVSTAVEPQSSSPLTDKFTETERARVHILISALPLIFEEAFKDLEDESLKTTPADFWGVPIDPLQSADLDPRVSVILVKFLRARNLDVDAAQTMFIKTLRWRHDFKTSDTVTEPFPDEVFGKTLFVFGKDKGGRPVSYNVYGRKDNSAAIFSDLDRFLRWRVGRMEEALRELDFLTVDSITQVFDYDGLTMASRDTNAKKAATTATKLFQDYYPETLAKKFFINVPAYMAWIFWAAKPFISAATFAKFQMVGKGPEVVGKAMLTHIDRAELPKQYGGDAEGY